MNARQALDLQATEKDFQQAVIDLAHLRGWRPHHTYDSRRSPHGLPDLLLVRPPRVVFAELKRETGRITPQQRMWLDDLRSCAGVETYLWRPSMWSEIEKVLL